MISCLVWRNSTRMSRLKLVRIMSAIHCASCTIGQLTFQFRISCLNTSKTAYSSFTLDATSFFAKYHFTPDGRNASSKPSGELSWTCRLQNRVTCTLQLLRTALTEYRRSCRFSNEDLPMARRRTQHLSAVRSNFMPSLIRRSVD